MAIILAQILAQTRGGQNLRWALDLAVSTFAIDHPLPRFDTFREQSSGHPGGGGRDERWRKFVGSISGLESFSSKRLTKKIGGESVMEPEH
jgi:hypothetical protein